MVWFWLSGSHHQLKYRITGLFSPTASNKVQVLGMMFSYILNCSYNLPLTSCDWSHLAGGPIRVHGGLLMMASCLYRSVATAVGWLLVDGLGTS